MGGCDGSGGLVGGCIGVLVGGAGWLGRVLGVQEVWGSGGVQRSSGAVGWGCVGCKVSGVCMEGGLYGGGAVWRGGCMEGCCMEG